MEIVSYDLEDINPDNFDLDVFSSSIPIDSSDLVTTTTTTTTAATTTASSPSSCASSCFCGAMNRGLEATTNANAIFVVDSPKNMASDDVASFDKAQQLQTTLFVLNSTSTATATTSSEDEMKRKKRSTPLKRKNNGKKAVVEVEDKRDLSSVVDSGLVVIKKHLSTDKPPEPYADIIAKAILSSDVNSMQLKDIYTYMSENYKEFVSRVAQKKWRNAIRHNLSSHRYFAKTTERNAQGYYWSIRPLYERELRTSLLSGNGSTNNKNKNRRVQQENEDDDDDDDQENEENNDCDDENEDEDEELTKSSKTKANKKSKTMSVKVAAKKGNKPKRLNTTPSGKSRRVRSTRNKVESSNLANMVTSNNAALVSQDLLRVRDDLNYSPTPYLTILNSDALLNSSIGPGSNLSSTTYNSSTSSTPAPSRSSSSSLSSSSYATMFNTSNNSSLSSMNQSQNDSAYFDGSSYYYYYYSPRLDMPPHQSSSSSSTSSTSSPSQQNWSANPSAQQTTTYRFLDSTNYSYMNGYGFDYSASNYS